MKQIWSFLCVLFLANGLRADQAPATASEAMNNHVATVKKFVNTNERELKHAASIAGNLAKIGGAIALSVFTVNMARDLAEITRQSRSHYKKAEPTFIEIWFKPHIHGAGDDNKRPFKSAPYFIAFPISAYLLYNGSHGIYKEIRALLEERNKPKQATKAEPVVIIEQEPIVVVPAVEPQPIILVTPPVAPAIEQVIPQIINEPVKPVTKSITIESTEPIEDSIPPLEPIPTSDIENENGQ